MPPETAKFLQDMLDCAQRIAHYALGKSKAGFTSDRSLRDAVQWNFIVIGEALSQLRHVDPDVAEKITEWHRIIAFRNQLIHGYGIIRDPITWSIVQEKVPVLIDESRSMLGV